MKDVRHSKAFDQLDAEQFAAYRAVALDRRKRLKDLVAFCKSCSVRINESMAMRDRDWFIAQDERQSRWRDNARVAQAFTQAVADTGGVAPVQTGAVNRLSELMFDYLNNIGNADEANIGKLTALAHALANMQRSSIEQYRAEVEARASQAKSDVREALGASRLSSDVLDKIDRAIGFVAKGA